MKCDCMVYDVDFRDLLETHDDVADDSLERTINLVLTDPPYNGSNERSMQLFA